MTEYVDRRTGPALSQRVPFDLFLVLGATAAILLAVVTELGPSTARAALGFGFVLLAPGYALVSALFPSMRPSFDPGRGISVSSVGVGERLLLALGLSVFLSPLVGLLLSFSPLGLAPATVIPAIAIVTLGATVVAAYRRSQLPVEERFGFAVFRWLADAFGSATGPDDRTDYALNVLLVVGVVIAASGIGVGLLTVDNGERFTEFGVLTTSEETGDLVAEGYPETLVRGETTPLVLSVTNQERRTVEYTVVVQLQRLDEVGRVVESSELDRIERTVPAGERWQTEHEVRPTMVGEDLRLTYLLYTDEVPANPTTENAYRHVHLWVDVERA